MLTLTLHSKQELPTMHTDLSPHLHTDKCNELIKKYFKCHEDVSFLKDFTYFILISAYSIHSESSLVIAIQKTII